MLKANKNDPQGEWNRLIEYQHKQQELQDMEEREESQQRKRQYRDELEKLINAQKLQSAQKQNENKEIKGLILQKQQERDAEEYQKHIESKNKAVEYARYGLEQEYQKKESQRQSLIQDRLRQQQLAQSLMEVEKSEYQSKWAEKARIKMDLAQSYKSVEEQKKIDQCIEKQRDYQLMLQHQNQLQKEEYQRNQFLDKLKGYGQNEAVLKKYNDLYISKEVEQRELQRRIVDEAAQEKLRSEEYKIANERAFKERMQQETLHGIMDQINQKQQIYKAVEAQKEREQIMVNNIQQNYNRINKSVNDKRQQAQIQYRMDLMNQMEEDKQRKIQQAQMSQVELTLNKQLIEHNQATNNYHIGVVPGLSKHIDYERLKQKAYIDQQLNRQVPSSMLPKRSRNISAYVAGSSISQINGLGYDI